MNHLLGLLEYQLKQKNQLVPLIYSPEKLINAHMLLCGMSGTGKSVQSVRFLDSAAKAGLELDVFDVHDELDGVYGAVARIYSQATGYGYNPLVVNPDPHTGGVVRQVNYFVGLVKSVTPQFGAKQEAALRYLLTDTYAAAGIFQKNPQTWTRKQLTEAQRTEIVEGRRWNELREYYPTMEDLRSYARRKIMALTMGGDNKSVSAYDQLAKTKNRLYNLLNRQGKALTDDEVKRLESQVADQKEKLLESYGRFVESIQTGREIDDILKYDSVEVLTSVLQRIDILNATGILQSNEPDFGLARARVHQIKSLATEQQIMFTKLRLREIFERYKRMGPTRSGTEVRHVIFLDEGHKYFTEDPDDIINVIAKEARKFGIALWCASQQPTEFPEAFLTNVGATVLLGIHPNYWKRSASMLRIGEDKLKFIRPKEVLSIKLQRDGQADPPFDNVVVPNPHNAYGQRVIDYMNGEMSAAA